MSKKLFKRLIKRTSQPVQKGGDRLTLEDLLKGVTAASIHGEFDWGEDVGLEIWPKY